MQRTPEFRALSRWGQVPVLQHGKAVLCQSVAILEFLAETLGTFGSTDAAARRFIREWLYWDADRLAPPVYGCYGVRLGEQGLLPIAVDPVLAADCRRRLDAALNSLDAELGGRSFLAAGARTIADLCCYGDVIFAELCGIAPHRWPAFAGWAGRLSALSGWQPPFDLLPMADAEIA